MDTKIFTLLQSVDGTTRVASVAPATSNNCLHSLASPVRLSGHKFATALAFSLHRLLHHYHPVSRHIFHLLHDA